MAAPLFENSIGWAQFRLLGGWKNLLSTSIGCLMIGAIVIFAMVKGLRLPSQEIFANLVLFFMVLQIITLLLYGTLRVSSSVRADVNARLLESHRLMPTPPVTAVLGYLLGSTAQAFSLFVVMFVLGAVCVTGARVGLQSWVFSNAVLLAFALFVWTIVLFFSFRGGGAGLGFVIGMAIMAASSGAPLVLLPAINVLLSPMIGTTIFDMRTGQSVDAAFLIAGGAQLIIALIYLTAAARRYTRDDTLTFDSLLGLLLLAVWTAVCVLGIRRHTDFMWRPRGAFPWRYQEIGMVVSISSVLLLAMLPVSSAVRAALVPAAKRAANRGWHASPALVVLAAVAIASATVVCFEPRIRPYGSELRTIIAAAAFLVGCRYMLAIAHRFNRGPRKFMLAWLILTWLAPLIAETIRSAAQADDEEDRMSQIGMVSPPGELYQIWSHNPRVHSDGFAGLATQCAIAGSTVVLYYATRKKTCALTGDRSRGTENL